MKPVDLVRNKWFEIILTHFSVPYRSQETVNKMMELWDIVSSL